MGKKKYNSAKAAAELMEGGWHKVTPASIADKAKELYAVEVSDITPYEDDYDSIPLICYESQFKRPGKFIKIDDCMDELAITFHHDADSMELHGVSVQYIEGIAPWEGEEDSLYFDLINGETMKKIISSIFKWAQGKSWSMENA